MISRKKPVDRISQLLQSGLGHDLKKLPYYRQVMLDPRAGFNNMVYRNYAVEIFDNLVSYVLNDAQLYNRLRQLLLTKHEELEIKEEKKSNHEEAGYKEKGPNGKKCHECTMFVKKDDCTAVVAPISPEATCEFFKAKISKEVKVLKKVLKCPHST